MGLATIQLAVAKNRWLDTALGAETGTFTPQATGTPRTITVHVSHLRQDRDRDETLEEVDRISLLCLRDESDADKGGIQNCKRGDRYVRPTDQDSDTRPYGFVGEVVFSNANYQRLIFERPKRTTQGTT